MFLIVDLVIIAIFALCIFLGYKKGLAGCLIKVLAFFIALAVSIVLFKPASAIVTSTTQVDENIQSSIVEVFEKEDAKDDKQKDEKDNNGSIVMRKMKKKNNHQ